MKIKNIKILYYYEVPTLLFCQDEMQNNYFFALFNEEKYQYIGKCVSIKDAIKFLQGEKDLKSIYLNSKSKYYLGYYNKNEFYADVYSGDESDDLLPADGLVLINPETALVNQLLKKLYIENPVEWQREQRIERDIDIFY